MMGACLRSLGLRVVHCLEQCSSIVLFSTFIDGHVRKSEEREGEKKREREREKERKRVKEREHLPPRVRRKYAHTCLYMIGPKTLNRNC